MVGDVVGALLPAAQCADKFGPKEGRPTNVVTRAEQLWAPVRFEDWRQVPAALAPQVLVPIHESNLSLRVHRLRDCEERELGEHVARLEPEHPFAVSVGKQ